MDTDMLFVFFPFDEPVPQPFSLDFPTRPSSTDLFAFEPFRSPAPKSAQSTDEELSWKVEEFLMDDDDSSSSSDESTVADSPALRPASAEMALTSLKTSSLSCNNVLQELPPGST